MKTSQISIYFLASLLIQAVCSSHIAQADTTTNYASLTGAHISPYTNWVTAATNIQDAIDANMSNVVMVAPGTYRNQTIIVNNDTVLVGAGYESTILNDGILISFGIIDGFTISDYNTEYGDLFIYGGIMRNCKVKNVGKFYAHSGLIENSIFEYNDIGIYAEQPNNLIIRNCLIYNNENKGVYILIYSEGGATIEKALA